MRKFTLKYIPLIKQHIIVLLLLMFYSAFLNAQNIVIPELENTKNKSIKVDFIKPTITFEKSEIISNVLKIINISDKEQEFIIELTIPNDWSTFIKSDKLYKLAPNDSLFVPVSILPKSRSMGNSKFMFSAYLFAKDSKLLGFTFFYALSKKITKWGLNVLPSNKLYFRNDQTVMDFQINLFNMGNEDQEIFLSAKQFNDKLILTDTSNKPLINTSKTIVLKPLSDTTFLYRALFLYNKKNIRPVYFDSYDPFANYTTYKYSILFNSQTPKHNKNNAFSVGQKVVFIKLPNNLKVNPFNRNVLPITLDLNVYNIFQNPMINLLLRGNTQIAPNKHLSYFTQASLTSSQSGLNSFLYTPYYIGYFTSKYQIEIGQVGFMGTRGLSAKYNIRKWLRVGAYASRGPGLYKVVNTESIGGNFDVFLNNNFRVYTNYNHLNYKTFKIQSDILSLNSTFKLFNKHYFSILLGGNQTPKTDTKVYGYLAGMNYNTQIIKSWNINTGAYYNSKYYMMTLYNPNSNRENLRINLFNYFVFKKKYAFNLVNYYNKYKASTSNNLTTVNNLQIMNQLAYHKIDSTGSSSNLTPSIFYNIRLNNSLQENTKGICLNTSKTNFSNNFLSYSTIRFGYHNATNGSTIKTKNTFFLLFSTMFKYHRFTYNFRYNFGNEYATNVNNYNPSTPQIISMGIRYQYYFTQIPYVIFNPYLGYTFSNLTGRTLNFCPEIWYYTKSRIRFKIRGEFSSSKRTKVAGDYRTSTYLNNNNEGPKVNTYFNLSAGVNYEFGIPIPSKKIRYNTTDFIAYFDINGNHIWDKNEDLLEDVVITVGSNQVLTGKLGRAKIENILCGTYTYSVFSLVNLDGWFPNKEDTLVLESKYQLKYVPFSRGIKLYGSVLIEREKYSATEEGKLDLSNIKIAATDGKVYNTMTGPDGKYQMYLPFGKYTISLDESILGDQFVLLHNNYNITMSDSIDNLYLPFHIIERQRKIKIKHYDTEGNLINSNSTNGSQATKPDTAAINQKLKQMNAASNTAVNTETNTQKPEITTPPTNNQFYKPTVQARYYVMAGSYRNRNSALQVVEELKAKGFSKAMLVGQTSDGLYRICYTYTQTNRDAIQELSKIRKNITPYVWLLEQNSRANSYQVNSIKYEPEAKLPTIDSTVNPYSPIKLRETKKIKPSFENKKQPKIEEIKGRDKTTPTIQNDTTLNPQNNSNTGVTNNDSIINNNQNTTPATNEIDSLINNTTPVDQINIKQDSTLTNPTSNTNTIYNQDTATVLEVKSDSKKDTTQIPSLIDSISSTSPNSTVPINDTTATSKPEITPDIQDILNEIESTPVKIPVDTGKIIQDINKYENEKRISDSTARATFIADSIVKSNIPPVETPKTKPTIEVSDAIKQQLSNFQQVPITEPGEIYKVQFQANELMLRKHRELSGLPDLVRIQGEDDPTMLYFTETFYKFEDAKDYKNALKDLGLFDVAVIAFKDGIKLPEQKNDD